MIPASRPENEDERQRRLDELQILDTLEEQAYDDLTSLAAHICNTPIALVSLVDRDRQWFKSHRGLDATETPRDMAFCAHAILDDRVMVVENAREDARFRDNPLVTGEPHVIFYAGAPLVLGDNIRVGTLCVMDNHPRGLSATQLDALHALARQVVSQLELRLRLRDLSQLDRTKDAFISMVSHELRTPLTAIHGSLGLVRSSVAGKLPPQAAELVDVAYRNGERLLAIVNDILDLAKLEAGRVALRLERLDVEGLLRQAVTLNRPLCERLGCAIDLQRTDGDALPLIVAGDEQRLLQVLGNLISNAAKFTHPGDTILLGFGRKGNQAVVEVTDHGPGIPADKIGELFTRFNQLEMGSDAKLPGTGLGLHICKLLVDQHQGAIGCRSSPGEYTTFHFSLPL